MKQRRPNTGLRQRARIERQIARGIRKPTDEEAIVKRRAIVVRKRQEGFLLAVERPA